MNTAVVPYVAPQEPPADELIAKMEKLYQLSDAIARAYDEMVAGKSADKARNYINLVHQREALRKTLPRLRIV